jgi:hypothetical protein
MEALMVRTLKVKPLPATIHVDPDTHVTRAEINMVFTAENVRASRHRAEAQAAAKEPHRPHHVPASGNASTLSTTRAPTGG